jgi:hypothetical protein
LSSRDNTNKETTARNFEHSRHIEILNRQVKNILDELQNIERNERGIVSKKKDNIVALAKTFEELHNAGAYTEPINTICVYICKLTREKGLLASERWIHESLDDKYKQVQFSPVVVEFAEVAEKNHDALEGSLIEDSLQEPEVSSSEASDPFLAKNIASKSIDEMTREELQIATPQVVREAKQLKDAAREKTRRAELMLEKCDNLRIAVDPEVRGREPLPVVSAISGESGPSEFSEALHDLADIIDRAGFKVEKYKPPQTLDKKFAKAVREMILIWKPWVDEKFRKDTFSWLHVAMDEAAHGKHAAATMHSTLLPDGTKRSLTREQAIIVCLDNRWATNENRSFNKHNVS